MRISSTVLLIVVLSVAGISTGYAQTLRIGDFREEQLRIQQLLNDSLTISFSNRPVTMQTYDRYMDAAGTLEGLWNRPLGLRETTLDGGIRLGIYEPVFFNTVNSAIPYGDNNEAAWYGRGLSSEIEGGFFVTSDWFTVSVRPHLVWQQNTDFDVPRFALSEAGGEPAYGSDVGIMIDRPYRFGPDPYWTFDWGYSSAALHYGSLELGYGTEPMWWGPAGKYPLVMSNNAPGFERVYLKTRSPLKIPYVGAFEFTWTGGWPEDSRWFADFGGSYANRERRIAGINANWNPSFAPGLYIGLTRVYHLYAEGGTFLNDVLLVIDPFTKIALPEEKQDSSPRERYENQLSGVYFRWVLPEAEAEFYAEYLREDHSYDLRDFATEPNNSRAWAFGLQKILRVFPFADLSKVHLEYTHLTASRIREIGRTQAYVYRNNYILQGHTNRGQVMGAAIGPGSNSLYVGLDTWFDDFKVGIFGQRTADNDQFLLNYNRASADEYGTGDIWRHRVNLDIGADVLWQMDSMVFSGSLIWTKAYNYGRYNYGDFDVDFESLDPHDVINLQLQLGVRYLF